MSLPFAMSTTQTIVGTQPVINLSVVYDCHPLRDTETMRLLIVEDDPLIADSLIQGLAPLGNTVEVFTNLKEARSAMAFSQFDLLVLDLGLPDGSGLSLLSELRKKGDGTPVLILTARDGVAERVKGLDLGADDYLIKPCSLAEIQARVRALLRRSQQRTDNQLRFGPLCFNPVSGEVTLDGDRLDLPPRELGLMEGLLLHAGRIVPREQLIDRLFGFGDVGPNALDLYISRLRKRLLGTGVRIRTLRGLGYRLEDDSA